MANIVWNANTNVTCPTSTHTHTHTHSWSSLTTIQPSNSSIYLSNQPSNAIEQPCKPASYQNDDDDRPSMARVWWTSEERRRSRQTSIEPSLANIFRPISCYRQLPPPINKTVQETNEIVITLGHPKSFAQAHTHLASIGKCIIMNITKLNFIMQVSKKWKKYLKT